MECAAPAVERSFTASCGLRARDFGLAPEVGLRLICDAGQRRCRMQRSHSGPMHNKIVPIAQIQARIHLVRGKRVMLDADLARFYGVATFNLNKAVSRNLDRFPEDFSFVLTLEETRNLIFQSGISSSQPIEVEHQKKAGRAAAAAVNLDALPRDPRPGSLDRVRPCPRPDRAGRGHLEPSDRAEPAEKPET